jgi:Zn-dependent peptidase ImmA (M78 family)
VSDSPSAVTGRDPAGVLPSGVRRREPTEDAEHILAEYWDGRLPVDPARIARSLGLRILTVILPSDRSGALVKAREEAPTILMNAADNFKRQRFTCAHEIGHYVRHAASPDEYEYIDYRDALASQGTDPEEIYANKFAASLIMPAKEVRRLANEGLNDLEMASRFDVSLEAMQYRLQSLGIQ